MCLDPKVPRFVDQDLLPIEVKAEENLQAKSLKTYCEKYHPRLAIRTSMANYRYETSFGNTPSNLLNIPLYAIQQLLQEVEG